MRFLLLALLSVTAIYPQGRAGRGATAEPASTATGAALVRENYSKFEYRIPMRDGIKLFASVYIPKDVFTDGRTYPMMLQRTPYNVAPYGADKFRASVGPSEYFARDKYIF